MKSCRRYFIPVCQIMEGLVPNMIEVVGQERRTEHMTCVEVYGAGKVWDKAVASVDIPSRVVLYLFFLVFDAPPFPLDLPLEREGCLLLDAAPVALALPPALLPPRARCCFFDVLPAVDPLLFPAGPPLPFSSLALFAFSFASFASAA